MQIIILGAGIGGLATYHALRQHLPPSTLIDIYEAHLSALTVNGIIGGGVTLGPNGQRAISVILPSAIPYIRARGFEFDTFTFRNDSGKLLGRMPFGHKERYGFSQIMATRSAVHESFLVEGDTDAKVHWSMKVKRVWETESGAHVEFEDGTIQTCDLLIGADGVWSKTREALFGPDYAPCYDGLTGFGGFIPFSELPSTFIEGIKQDAATMTISRIGAFGFSPVTHPDSPDPKLLWFCSSDIDPPPARNTPRGEMLPLLLKRHGDWKSPYDASSSPDDSIFRRIVTIACTGKENNNWGIFPRFYTPTLPHWTSLHGLTATGSEGGSKGAGRIILIGDAAHAMPPDGAQGVSCAVEDALALALLLKHYLSSTEIEVEAISKAAKAYEDVRIPRVKKILAEAKGRVARKKETSTIQSMIREYAIWVTSWLPEWFLYDEVYGYNVQDGVAKYLGSSS